MKPAIRSVKFVLIAALAVLSFGYSTYSRAADLPLAAASPLSGVAFDDRPLILPVQRNFQMAMLTSGSELGRSCGKMEAYGWRMSQTEQGRVNQIFNNTVDRLRLMGYTITPQNLTSVSKDITLFTADHDNKHFIFLWSAGELGLVLNLCQTSAPVPTLGHATLTPSVQTFAVPMDSIVPASVSTISGKHGAKNNAGGFSPVGKWVGGYTCEQGYTGGTLEISHLHGQNFDGVFKFYPTAKNETVPPGSYTVYGQYDSDSRRILINPGKWLKRPPNYYNTVIVGAFDPIAQSFSAYFQGISGCTSFEGKRVGEETFLPVSERPLRRAHHAKKHAVKKKKPAKPVATSDMMAPLPVASDTPVVPVSSTVPAAAPVSAPPALPLPPPPAPIDPTAKITVPSVSVAKPAVITNAPVAPAAPPALPAEDKGGGIDLPGSGK